jgi:hypothetical protein
VLQTGADGSVTHKLCRSCFIAAIGGWFRQQSQQMGQDLLAFLAAMPSRLTCLQMQQLTNWVNAAFDLSSSSSSGGGSSGVFVLPSTRHTRLLEGRRLADGLDWPLEYCSLQVNPQHTIAHMLTCVTDSLCFFPYSRWTHLVIKEHHHQTASPC